MNENAWLRTMGIEVFETPYLREDQMMVLGPVERPEIVIGTRPLTEAEFAGREARWLVREGYRDVLAWLGEDVGPRPVRGETFMVTLRALIRR